MSADAPFILPAPARAFNSKGGVRGKRRVTMNSIDPGKSKTEIATERAMAITKALEVYEASKDEWVRGVLRDVVEELHRYTEREHGGGVA